MAWIDDRIWCHPKFSDLSSHAFAAWCKGVAYSSGMSTAGHLTAGQQKLIGADSRARRELVAAGLWDVNGDGESVVIHDWNDHNGKRDARRAADRERKRRQRNNEDNP